MKLANLEALVPDSPSKAIVPEVLLVHVIPWPITGAKTRFFSKNLNSHFQNDEDQPISADDFKCFT